MASTRHVVTFDVNVWLDVARLVGEPFTWDKFNKQAALLHRAPVPDPSNRQHDSLRAVAACTTGIFVGPHTFEVWTSDHINILVYEKARQPDDPRLPDEDRGLGWSDASAEDLLHDLVWEVIDQSGGDTVGELTIPMGNPPLDHEDGMVYRTAHAAADGETVDCERHCVTNDKPFRRAALPGWATVRHPAEFLNYVRSARRAASMAAMPRPVLTPRV